MEIIDIKSKKNGFVSIVGAGPGKKSLLTLAAHDAILAADVVLVDALVSEEIKAIIPAHCQIVFVGKRCGKHSASQEEICQQMVAFAKRGKQVVRLKGGDPMVFGRGSEEALALKEAGIEYEIIPGISAAIGASSFAGIPLTHRNVSHGVTFITGHALLETKVSADWVQAHTAVIYMGITVGEQIGAHLLECGVASSTPIAIVARASSDEQQTLSGTLAQMPQLIAQAKKLMPAIIVIGEVTRFASLLQWQPEVQTTIRERQYAN